MQRMRGLRRTLMGLVSGATLLAIGTCTTADIQTQFANGLTSALTGLFRIGAESLANSLFGVG